MAGGPRVGVRTPPRSSAGEGRVQRLVSLPGRVAMAPGPQRPPRPSWQTYRRVPGVHGDWRRPGSRCRCQPWHRCPLYGGVPVRKQAGRSRAGAGATPQARPGGHPVVRTETSRVLQVFSPSAYLQLVSGPGRQLAARRGRDPPKGDRVGHWQARAVIRSRRNRSPTRWPVPRGSSVVHTWCTRWRRRLESPSGCTFAPLGAGRRYVRPRSK